jgi:hypothetical protein
MPRRSSDLSEQSALAEASGHYITTLPSPWILSTRLNKKGSSLSNVSVDVTTKNKTLAGAWAGGTGYDTE